MNTDHCKLPASNNWGVSSEECEEKTDGLSATKTKTRNREEEMKIVWG
jgi:hypothetical protein